MKKLSDQEILSRWDLDENGCHIYNGSIHPKGYGVVCVKRARVYAHRFFYEKLKGPIPEKFLVRHLCHNKRCVNPAHLEVGTQKDNMKDMVDAGRQAKGMKIAKNRLGEDNPSAKLSWQDVERIRALRRMGLKLRQISEVYSVSEGSISAICSGKKWGKKANGRYECREVDLS